MNAWLDEGGWKSSSLSARLVDGMENQEEKGNSGDKSQPTASHRCHGRKAEEVRHAHKLFFVFAIHVDIDTY